MGSVLGPIFCNFYKSDLENEIFNSIKKPPIYLRYVDDILILVNNMNEINGMQMICIVLEYLISYKGECIYTIPCNGRYVTQGQVLSEVKLILILFSFCLDDWKNTVKGLLKVYLSTARSRRELWLSVPFPTTITVPPNMPPKYHLFANK